MANRIKLKRSNTSGSAPTTANIEVGEVAMNMADRLLYFRDPSNNILSFTIEDLNDFDTDDLTEGATNLYYTDARVNTNFSTKTTDALTEGATNLYYTDARVDANLNTSTATSGEVLSWNGSDYDWVAASGGLADVVDDTTPQLGGNLDLNSNNINGTGNIDISGSITGVGMTNNATSFGEAFTASRTSSSGSFGATFQNNKSTTLADGDFSTAAGFGIKPSTGSTAYPAFIHGEYHSITGNRLHFKMYDDGVSTFGIDTGLDLGANDAEFFDGDLTLSTDGTNQTIGSTTGDLNLRETGGLGLNIESSRINATNNVNVQDKWLQISNTSGTPYQYFYRNHNHGSGQIVGETQYFGQDSTGSFANYATIATRADDATAGALDGRLSFSVQDNNTLTEKLRIKNNNTTSYNTINGIYANNPYYYIQHNDTSPTNGTDAGQIQMWGSNSSSTDYEYSKLRTKMEDVTAGAEESSVEIQISDSGALTQGLKVESGLVRLLNNDYQFTKPSGGFGSLVTTNYTTFSNASGFEIGNTANTGSLDITRYTATMSNGDEASRIRFWGKDDAGNFTRYGYLRQLGETATDGSETGRLRIEQTIQGTNDVQIATFGQDIELNKEVVFGGGYREAVNNPSTSGTISPDVANGTYGVITLSGNITFNNFAAATAGQSYTLVIKQPSSGGPYTLSSTMLFSGGGKTLSTAANAVDVMTVFYDGTSYYASLTTGYA